MSDKGYTHDFPGTVLERALRALREHDSEYHYTTPEPLIRDLEAEIKRVAMGEYTCPLCGEAVGMMGHGPQPCPGKLSPKATERGRLRVELGIVSKRRTCPFCNVGEWKESGTKGRLVCTSCGSHALDGRKAVAVPMKGDES